MKHIQFTCDGCDLVEHVVLLTQDAANLSVDGWVAYRAVVRENDAEPYEISADLCPRCVLKMRHAVNPAHWPRASMALSDGEKQRAVG